MSPTKDLPPPRAVLYLDSNVYASVDEQPGLRAKLVRLGTKVPIAFSRDIIAEITSRNDPADVQQRLALVQEVSNGLMFQSDLHGSRLEWADPQVIYPQVLQAKQDTDPALSMFASMAGAFKRAGPQQALNLSTVELNNLTPAQAIEKINEALSIAAEAAAPKMTPGTVFPRTFDDMVSLVARVNKEHHGEMSSAGVGIAFDLFDTFGYWPDRRKTDTQLRATQVDVLHANHASRLQTLVTADGRFAKKAEAVYWYYKQPTRVLDAGTGIDLLLAER